MQHYFSAGFVIYTTIGNERLYLLLKYRTGHWDFPKGKIEKGETKEAAALRELKEETGLHCSVIPKFEESFSYIFRDYKDKALTHKQVYWFIGKTDTQTVALSEEHLDYKWLPFNQAIEQATYKNAKDLLQKVEIFLSKS